MASALGELSPRALLRGLFCTVLVSAAAAEAVRFGVVERPASLYASMEAIDPVVARVGGEVLRLSDAKAHAAYTGLDVPSDDVPSLLASGTVDDAVDHLALAQLAKDTGVGDSLEIRAAIALAEREILAEAYLERLAAEVASEAKIHARYEQEKAELERRSVLRLAKIVVADRDTAEALAKRLPRASFSALASQKSIDAATAKSGGQLPPMTVAELPQSLAAAVSALPIGGVTEPIKTEEGWVLVKLESRRTLRMPPLSERREAIARDLRAEAVAEALGVARERVPMRIRSAEAILDDESRAVTGILASARRL